MHSPAYSVSRLWLPDMRDLLSLMQGSVERLATQLRSRTDEPVESKVRSMSACGIVAALIWLGYFYYAANIRFLGDDFKLLVPLLNGGLAQSLDETVRPLEFAIALASKLTGRPMWLVASLAAYVGTALATLALWRITGSQLRTPFWQVVVCAATPLAATTYFQIDTVSQALANLFVVVLAIATLSCLQARSPLEAARRGWIVAGLAILCLLSKETSYGFVFFASVLICIAHGRRVLASVLLTACVLSACIVWSYFFTFDVSVGSHYGLKNPLYWLFAVVFSAVVAVSPVPTSLVLTGTAAEHGGYLLLVAVGATAMLVAVMYLGARALGPMQVWIRTRRHPSVDPVVAFLLLCFAFSLMPSMVFKASELYASQSVPFLKCLLLRLHRGTVPLRVSAYWAAVAILWCSASMVNVMFYSVRTGYRASLERPTSALQRPIVALETVVPKQRAAYSIYSQEGAERVTIQGECVIANRERTICLPKNIASGFPRLLSVQAR